MVAFYNQGDKAIYDSGQYFIPQEAYRLNYAPPIVEEEEQESSIGIPNTNSFINFSNSDNRNFNTGNFKAYTAQPSGSFVTNRTDYGSSGYIPGTEPEETFMDKAGNLIARGIGSFIPGGNFFLGMANKLDRFDNLSAQDKAFAEMQMGIDEQNIHGFGNLPNQDRYGYNKRSMFGNYANVVQERVDIANKRIAEGKELRPIDNYYLEKQKEQEDIKNQIDFNNFVRQRITANNIRRGIEEGTINPNFNIHSDDKKSDGGDNTFIGGGATIQDAGGTAPGNMYATDYYGDNKDKNNNTVGSSKSSSTGGGHSGSGYQGKTGSHHYRKGGLTSL